MLAAVFVLRAKGIVSVVCSIILDLTWLLKTLITKEIATVKEAWIPNPVLISIDFDDFTSPFSP